MLRDTGHKRMRASALIAAKLHNVDAHHIRKIVVVDRSPIVTRSELHCCDVDIRETLARIS